MSAFSLSAADELVRRVVEEADAKKARKPLSRGAKFVELKQLVGWEGNVLKQLVGEVW